MTVTVACNVGVAVPFIVAPLDLHPDIELVEDKFEAPANADLVLTFRYQPQRYTTCSAKYALRIDHPRGCSTTIALAGHCQQGLLLARTETETTLRLTARLGDSQAQPALANNFETSARATDTASLPAQSPAKGTTSTVNGPRQPTPPSTPPQNATNKRRTKVGAFLLKYPYPLCTFSFSSFTLIFAYTSQRSSLTSTQVSPNNSIITSTQSLAAEKTKPLAAQLNGLAGVNNFLNQNMIHFHVDHAICPLDPDPGHVARAEKEKQFLKEIRAMRARSKGLGEPEISPEQRREILAARRQVLEVCQAQRCGRGMASEEIYKA